MPLTEARKKQLDAILVKMADQDAPVEDVKAIVADFKRKFGGEVEQKKPLGDRLLKAVVPSVDEPLPDEKPLVYPNMAPEHIGMKVPVGPIEKTAIGVGRVVGGALGTLSRFAGAAVHSPIDAGVGGLIDKMGDPEEGLLRTPREALSNSEAPDAVKAVGNMVMGGLEDPASYVGGVFAKGGALSASKYNKSSKALASAPIQVSDDVVKAAKLAGNRAGKASGVVEGIPLTKGQQAALKGVPVDRDLEKVARLEAKIQAENQDIWQQMVKGQEQAVAEKASNVRAKYNFNEASHSENAQSVVHRIVDSYKSRRDHLKANYNKIEAVAGSQPLQENDALQDAFATMDSHGFYQTRLTESPSNAGKMVSVPVFEKKRLVEGRHTVNTAEPTTEMVPNSASPTGKPMERTVVDEAGEPVMRPTKVSYPTVHEQTVKVKRPGLSERGVSETVADAVTSARRMVDDDMSYGALKEARSIIGHHIGELRAKRGSYGYKDHEILTTIYAKLSNAMEEQIKKTWDEAAVKDWIAHDKMFSKQDDFRKIMKVFRPSKDGNIIPEEAIRRITDSRNAENLDALMSVKALQKEGALPAGTFEQIQNAVFNDVIARSSRNGVIDGDMLLKNANDIPESFYNEIFSNGLEDDMAQLIMDATAQKMAHKLKIVEGSPNRGAQMLRDAGGNAGMWALFVGGKKFWAGMKIAELAKKLAATRSPKAAANYIRQVDNKSIVGAFGLTAAKTGALLQGAEESLTPESKQPQEARRR